MTIPSRAKVELTIRRAAARYPFHAAILERFEIIKDPQVQTMGVQASTSGVRLYYAPDFVAALPPDQLLGVLLHEVHHVLFRHVLANDDDYPDGWARVVAEEVTVNEFVREEPLPKGAILLLDFPVLPPMESTDERYARLCSHSRRFPIGSLGHGIPSNAKPMKGTIDNHGVWSIPAGDLDAAASAIDGLIDEAAAAVGFAGVPSDFHGILALDGTDSAKLSWQDLLRRYTGQIRQPSLCLHRPSRRLPHLVGVVPGHARRHGRPRILAAIDTSGSITPNMLKQISAELARLNRDFEVTVVECDQAIHAVYPYRPVRKVRGRGGTDLRPPLKQKFLRAHRPDLVVYFTDGFGPAPVAPPSVPVIWCLVPGGEAPARWGRVIHMHDEPSNSEKSALLDRKSAVLYRN